MKITVEFEHERPRPNLDARDSWSKIIEQTEEVMECYENGERCKDWEEYLTEALMMIIYGDKVYDFFNEREEYYGELR